LVGSWGFAWVYDASEIAYMVLAEEVSIQQYLICEMKLTFREEYFDIVFMNLAVNFPVHSFYILLII